VRAIEQGFFQEAIGRSAYQQLKRQESGDAVVVGVNRFTDDEPPPVMGGPDFHELAKRQRARLEETKQTRDAASVSSTLDGLKKAAGGTDALMPSILKAVKVRATLGEISDVLRDVWGVYRSG
jgi:methylmalonyl-CoA mutase N-terminal domain/subunit